MHTPIVGHEGMELLTCKGRAVVSDYYVSMYMGLTQAHPSYLL